MANITKAKAAAALQAAGIQRKSFSLPEICARNDLSEGFMRKLRKLNLGPNETQILDRVIVTEEDEAIWLKALKERKADTAANVEPTED
jgi:hypothetical protein